MDDDKVIPISSATNNGMSWAPKDMLKTALEDADGFSQAVLITVGEDGSIVSYTSRITIPELMYLIELTKLEIINGSSYVAG